MRDLDLMFAALSHRPIYLVCAITLWSAIACSVARSRDVVNTRWTDRTFALPGDIYIASLFPLFERNPKTNECSDLHAIAVLLQALPFVDVLRQHDFQLTAQRAQPDGNVKNISLQVGYLVADQCQGSLEPATFALRLIYLPTTGPFCQLITSVPRPIPGAAVPLPRILAAVGPVGDEAVAVTAAMVANLRIPQLTPFSSLTCGLRSLSDCAGQNGYENLFQVASPIYHEPHALADLLTFFNWTYFAVIGTADDIPSLEMMHEFLAKINGVNFATRLCMAFRTTMEYSTKDAQTVYQKLLKHHRAKVVVMLTPPKHVELLINTIWTDLNRTGFNRTFPRIWIGWHKWSWAIDLVLQNPQYAPIMQAVLVTNHGGQRQFRKRTQEMAELFVDYSQTIDASLLRTSRDNSHPPWWCQLIEVANNCGGVCNVNSQPALKRCQDNMTVQQKFESINLTLTEFVDRLTLLATETAYQALQKLFVEFVEKDNSSAAGEQLAVEFYNFAYPRIRDTVKNAVLPCGNETCAVFPNGTQSLAPMYYILAVKSSNHQSGDVGFWTLKSELTSRNTSDQLTMYGLKDIKFGRELFNDNTTSIPTSSCTPVCSIGQGRSPSLTEASCCYNCMPCGNGEIGDGKNCTACGEGMVPNTNRSKCVPLPVLDPLSKVTRIVLFSLSTLLLLLLIFTSIVFARFRNTAVMRSADRTLTALFLGSMITRLLLEVLVLTVLEQDACAIVNIIGSLLMISTVAVVVVKTSRMVRIYFAAKNLRGNLHRKWSMMTSAQIALLCSILGIALVVEILKLQLNPSTKKRVHTQTATYEICIEPFVSCLITDVFVGILLATATVLAFFTRKLMLSFREARLLLLLSFSLSVLWTTEIGVHELTAKTGRPLLKSLFVLTHTFMLWVWLLAPRLYILLLRPSKRNTVREPRRSMRKILPLCTNTVSSTLQPSNPRSFTGTPTLQMQYLHSVKGHPELNT